MRLARCRRLLGVGSPGAISCQVEIVLPDDDDFPLDEADAKDLVPRAIESIIH